MKFSELNLNTGKEQSKKNSLGRGLRSLIPEGDGGALPSLASMHGLSIDSMHIYQLPLEKVKPQKDQPRRYFDEEALNALAESIKQDGILQPLVVRKSTDHYEIIAGERRWRAAKLAGLTTVPAIVKDLNDDDTFALALVENIQRQDLTPMEEARAYQRLIKQYKLTQEQVASRVGFQRSTVANTVRLLNLPEDLQQNVDEGTISAGHARALLSMSSVKAQRELAKRIVDEHLSVRQAERLARMKNSAPVHPISKETGVSQESAQKHLPADKIAKLQQSLNCQVTINEQHGHGTIELHFNTYAELDAITQQLIKKL